MSTIGQTTVDLDALRAAVQEEYEVVASEPQRGFHFHTGRPLAALLGYESEWLEGIGEGSIESFAGTGNPFSMGELGAGERVVDVDVGCGAGIDSLIAAKMVGPAGAVVGVDMTVAMLEKARTAADGVDNVEFQQGFGEEIPVPDGWADVVISNGVLNLMPDKARALAEMARVLKPEGRLQLGDILVDRPVPENAKEKIELWTG